MLRNILAFALLAAIPSTLVAQKPSDASPPDEQKQSPVSAKGNVEILSDTMGVDFGPYLQHAMYEIKRHWYDLVPDVAKSPIMKSGTVVLQFAITKDGKITGLRYVGSSGDIALDRAAYGAIIASDPFASLPLEFHGSHLEVRIRFLYNPTAAEKNGTVSLPFQHSPPFSAQKPSSFSVPFGLHLDNLRPEPGAKQDAMEEIGQVEVFDRSGLRTPASRNFLEENLLPAIRQHWRQVMPEKARRLKETASVTVSFTIHKDGSFSPVSVDSSGDSELDNAVAEAVRLSAPVPLAKEFYPDLQVSLIFSYPKEQR